jgi:type IV secretion system protein VirB8
LRIAWTISAVAAIIALAEAIALAALAPLKTVVPYTLLVDRQTGYVQALKPLERDAIAPDKALTRSFLAQYVIAREGFQIESLKDDYRKVALWSAGEARERYVKEMQASNPVSTLATLPRQALVEVEVRSISSLSPNTSLVRFATYRVDSGNRRREGQPWSAVVTYRFSGAEMSEADRLINPLGFQVVRYRRNAEIPPAVSLEEVARPTLSEPLPSARALP